MFSGLLQTEHMNSKGKSVPTVVSGTRYLVVAGDYYGSPVDRKMFCSISCIFSLTIGEQMANIHAFY